MVTIITTILCSIGIVGFYLEMSILTYIASAISILEQIIGFVSGTLKSFTTLIIAIIVGIVVAMVCKISVIKCIAVSICFENVIMEVSGWILMLFLYKPFQKDKK